MPDGLFASIQVAHWPFAKNWQHLAQDPRHVFLEVGANNHELERDELDLLLQDLPGGFLISFEPLLDKYGCLCKSCGVWLSYYMNSYKANR